jgi:UDP-N-acetylmuramate-alanine ligase
MTINSPFWVRRATCKPNQRGGFDFTVMSTSKPRHSVSALVSLQVPGVHNVRNAWLLSQLWVCWDLSRTKAAEALAEFTGTGRRFQLRGR